MTRYCTKKIVRYVDGIVCMGDVFQTTTDFNTGLVKIAKHEKNEGIDRTNLKNIEKAYAIAYVEELGTIVPYVKIIEKKRIMTAYNCSPSKEKTVWNNHTERMVIKTAYWCLYNDILKPFVEIPSDLQESFAETEEDMNFDNADTSQDKVDENVYDLPTEDFSNNYSVTDDGEIVENDADVAQDFVDYLDEQEKLKDKPEEPEHITISYAKYKDNPDKYFLVKGSYDPVAKTCKVIEKYQ